MKKHIANSITGIRIAGSFLLLLFPVPSPEFTLVYLLCGFTDMIDGTVARLTDSTSRFGATLDTVADFLFLTNSFLKWMPVIILPGWLWLWILLIAAIKAVNFLCGFFHKEKDIFPHTLLNKMTGLLLFLFPLTHHAIPIPWSATAICIAATLSAIRETY